ncbi:MAG: Phosphinothricin N-acetyltransferase [candidate division BRC1 bacterium ADurb.BinA364]|nr:MAG: Phosphinothricin N-acetyltransferase [candidate division BRC1 bacterium ADurb.BinA364]
MNECLIRHAREVDLPAVRRIYNDAILHSTAVFIEAEADEEWARRWLSDHQGARLALVADIDGEAAGWGSISEFSSRCGYRFTGEVSIYIDSRFRRRGLGERLARALEEQARRGGLHSLVALIEASNAPSLRLFEKLGYEKAGLLREAGYKFGQWLSVAYYQKMLG